MNWRRELRAAARRVGIAFGLIALMAAIFWLIFLALS